MSLNVVTLFNEDLEDEYYMRCKEKEEPAVPERNLVAISIKHTEYKWKFGKPCVLWGEYRTKDDEKRCYAGYTIYPNNAELYSLEDWANSGYVCDWMKLDAPVKLCIDFCKKYKKYDTVLVTLDDYIKYCEFAELLLDRPKEE